MQAPHMTRVTVEDQLLLPLVRAFLDERGIHCLESHPLTTHPHLALGGEHTGLGVGMRFDGPGFLMVEASRLEEVEEILSDLAKSQPGWAREYRKEQWGTGYKIAIGLSLFYWFLGFLAVFLLN